MFRERGPLATNVTYNSLVNLPGRKDQPYKTWKGAKLENQSTISAVAVNSRPVNDSTPVFINQRRPIASKHNAKGRANPIKHWRRQLMPTQGNQGNQGQITGRVSVSQVMDRPGGSVYLAKANSTKPPTCNPTDLLKTQLITNYLYNYYVNPNCTNSSNCGTDSNGRKVPIYNPQKIRRPASTIVKKDYYQTHSAYLKGRVKTYNQNQTIAPIKDIKYFLPSANGPATFIHPTDNPNGTQVYHSIYCTDVSCNSSDSRMVRIIYKPSNFNYSQQGAVSSNLRIANLQKQTINTAASNLKEKFGTYSANNSRFRGVTHAPITTKTFNQILPGNSTCPKVQIVQTQNSGRQPSGGTGNHTVCRFIHGSKIRTNLFGTIISRCRAPGSWAKGPILPQKTECQLILEALGEVRSLQNEYITYYDDFENNPLNPPSPLS